MSSLFGKGRGKGHANQGEGGSRPSQRSRRQEVAEEISRQYAERLQEEENERFAQMVDHMEDHEFVVQEDFNEDEGQASDEQEGDEQEGDELNQPPQPKEPKSDMFKKHFRKVLSDEPPLADGRRRYLACCNYCIRSYKWIEKGGYGTLKRHMDNFHPMEFGIPTTQTQIQQPSGTRTPGMSSSPLFKFEKNVYEDAMARYCAMEKQPFNYADRETYEASYKIGLGPHASKVTRTNMLKRIRRQCMEKKVDLGKYLNRLDQKVSICSDVWTDAYNKNSYMGVTVHWVDSKWHMQKRLIAFREFEEPHNAHNIALIIIAVLNEFMLVNKVFSVGFDNATSNTASIPDLMDACMPSFNGKFFHARCICHILNLCVQDALGILQDVVAPIRNAIKALHKSKVLGKKWQKYCRTKNIAYTCFIMDVSHRWNSTFEMLNSTLEHKGHFCDFLRKEFTNFQIQLNENNWDSCTDLFCLLKCFHKATKDLSGVYYCTSVKVLEHCMYVAMAFKACFSKPNLSGVIYFMVTKWLKYFRDIPMVFLIAKCLDPKWKYEGVCELIDIYYEAFRSMDMSGLVIDGEQIFFDLPNVFQVKEGLLTALRLCYEEYKVSHSHLDNRTPSYSSRMSSYDSPFDSHSLDPLDPLTQQMQNVMRTRMQNVMTQQGRSELDMYLQTPFVFGPEDAAPNIDVMRWWSRRDDYPILSIMAKEFFAVPASTVSVEQAFSLGGLMLDQRRSNMKPANIEATMLLDDWCRADLRVQEPDWDDRNESEDEAFTETDRSSIASGATSGATSGAE